MSFCALMVRQNHEKVDMSILTIFLLPVLVRKYYYIGNAKQVLSQVKLKNLLLLVDDKLWDDTALTPDPTNFGFVNCRSIHNKGPRLEDLIQYSDLDILGLAETHSDQLILTVSLILLHQPITTLSKNHSVLDLAVVLAFCIEKPFLPLLSLHRFLDNLKSSYYI